MLHKLSLKKDKLSRPVPAVPVMRARMRKKMKVRAADSPARPMSFGRGSRNLFCALTQPSIFFQKISNWATKPSGTSLQDSCYYLIGCAAEIAARTSSQKSINYHGPSMQHSTSFRHMLSLRYIICCFTLLMLYSGTPNLVLNGERKKGFCAFN
jgi:hypothetical protein